MIGRRVTLSALSMFSCLALIGCSAASEDAEEVASTEAAATASTITSPPAGTALKATSQTFTWTTGADEYWLNVGTTSGGSDIYKSASLGKATSLKVTGLPLTGATIYVQLVSRFGYTKPTSVKSYTAAKRRGMAVVADFADKKLENWTGPGFKSEADVNAQLRQMEAHWDWLSRGKEKTRWDLVRVQLPVNLSPGVYPDGDFRAEAIRLAKLALPGKGLAVADFDVNSDGILDGVWIIPANNGVALANVGGGTTHEREAMAFVDGQDSDSVVGGVTGNFNHEMGHCLGLPDIYGTSGTLFTLSLMDYSWRTPAIDFSAYERVRLGWLTPTVVSTSKTGIVLNSANDQLAAIKIPTSRAQEYFLIEYRKKPASGFGSNTANYDGLEVLHVLEGSEQSFRSPRVKVEPADGVLPPGGAADANDLLYPGNPVMKVPFEGKTYFGTNTVFQIQNVTRPSSSSLKFDVVMGTSAPNPPNLITNSTFETSTSPWATGGWITSDATFEWATTGYNSARSISVASPTTPNDVEWRATVTGLAAGSTYYLCGYVKGENVVGYENAEVGGGVSISGTFSHSEGGFGTFPFTPFCTALETSAGSADVACRLGRFGSIVTGKIWCDNMTLVQLRSTF